MRFVISFAILTTLWSTQIALSQQAAEPGGFAPENAILNTAVPFAIGAREARQDLRGSFGWPTFQEGLVEGVYFRFDPDGYARFAPSPRLDTDVFEVLCRPGTTNCLARKGDFSVFLNTQGALQLRVDDYRDSDTIFVSEGVTEIQLPPQVMMPLDARLESLLSVGGDMIIRRGDTENSRTSLTGFGAVTTYLRWVASNQNPSAFPNGWPIPSATTPSANRFDGTDWDQIFPRNQSAPLLQQEPVASATPTPQPTAPDGENDLLALARALSMPVDTKDQSAPDIWSTSNDARTVAPTGAEAGTAEIQTLQRQVQRLMSEIERLERAQSATPTPASDWGNPKTNTAQTPSVTTDTSSHLAFLVDELGMSVTEALDLLETRHSRLGQTPPAPYYPTAPVTPKPQTPVQAVIDPDPLGPGVVTSTVNRDEFINDILNELLSELPPEEPANALSPNNSILPETAAATVVEQGQDFELLSDYLRGVFDKSQ